MRIALNLLPLRTGGGVQVALDFLGQLAASDRAAAHSWSLVCREGMPFPEVAPDRFEHVHRVPDRLLSRILFENVGARAFVRLARPDVVFTLFGPQWRHAGSAAVVVGCAYSNLFHPEVPFWSHLPLHRRLWKRFVDRRRLAKVLAADVRIFETPDLMERARRQFGLDPEAVACVPPAASALVDPTRGDPAVAERCRSIPEGFRVVTLSGFHPNKNLPVLLRAAAVLRERYGTEDVVFVTTIAPEGSGFRSLQRLAGTLRVERQWYNLGPVPAAGCVELYRVASAAVLPSRLESFSNMIAEAWSTDVPLIVSDFSWSRSVCREGAAYVPFDDAEALAASLHRLRSDSGASDRLARAGRDVLATYPSSSERFGQYLDILESAPARLRGQGTVSS